MTNKYFTKRNSILAILFLLLIIAFYIYHPVPISFSKLLDILNKHFLLIIPAIGLLVAFIVFIHNLKGENIFEEMPQYYANIEQALSGYIKSKSHRALLLYGDWGNGKTHFIKKWKDFIKDEEPIYLSLNGRNTLSEINTDIAEQLYQQFTMNKFLRTVAHSIFGNYLKMDMRFISPDKITIPYITSLNKNFKPVVIFDDLERCKIPVQELLGYINDIAEHEQLKVILVCDYDKLKENYEIELEERIQKYNGNDEKKKNYKEKNSFEAISGKTIGQKVHFYIDKRELLHSILEEDLKERKYNNLLEYGKKYIKSVANSDTLAVKDLRFFQEVLFYAKKCFDEVKDINDPRVIPSILPIIISEFLDYKDENKSEDDNIGRSILADVFGEPWWDFFEDRCRTIKNVYYEYLRGAKYYVATFGALENGEYDTGFEYCKNLKEGSLIEITDALTYLCLLKRYMPTNFAEKNFAVDTWAELLTVKGFKPTNKDIREQIVSRIRNKYMLDIFQEDIITDVTAILGEINIVEPNFTPDQYIQYFFSTNIERYIPNLFPIYLCTPVEFAKELIERALTEYATLNGISGYIKDNYANWSDEDKRAKLFQWLYDVIDEIEKIQNDNSTGFSNKKITASLMVEHWKKSIEQCKKDIA